MQMRSPLPNVAAAPQTEASDGLRKRPFNSGSLMVKFLPRCLILYFSNFSRTRWFSSPAKQSERPSCAERVQSVRCSQSLHCERLKRTRIFSAPFSLRWYQFVVVCSVGHVTCLFFRSIEKSESAKPFPDFDCHWLLGRTGPMTLIFSTFALYDPLGFDITGVEQMSIRR